MNELKIFENPAFGQVRTTERDGEIWFVAADVCQSLDLDNNRQALTRLDTDEKGVISTDTPGGQQEMAAVLHNGNERSVTRRNQLLFISAAVQAFLSRGSIRTGFADKQRNILINHGNALIRKSRK